MRAVRIILPVFLVLVLLAGCSSVFTSTITGTVQEESGSSYVGLENIDVYAFLDKSERDRAVSSNTQPVTTVSIFHGITNADGDFSIPIEWQTTSPTFGKTADRRTIYLAYYSEDFGGMTAASSVSYLSSERTNAMETETLVRTRQTYTLNLVIKNYSQNNAAVSATNFTVIVKDSDSKILYSGTPDSDAVTFSYSVSGLSGTVAITPNVKDSYAQCGQNGEAADTITFSFIEDDKTVRKTAATSTIYVKDVKTAYTLNLDIWDVASYNSVLASYTSVIAATNFTVTVGNGTDKSATGYVSYYSGVPTANSITFSTSDAIGTLYVTLVPTDKRYYKQCAKSGIVSNAAVEVTFDNADETHTSTADGHMKTLSMPALTITGNYGDGKTTSLNGVGVSLYQGSSVTGDPLQTAKTQSSQYSDQVREYGTFSFSIPTVYITDDSYVNDSDGTHKVYSVTYTVKADGGANTPSVTFDNKPTSSASQSVAIAKS